MRLVDLNPRFVGHGGDGVTNQDGSAVPQREGVGLSYDCPCGCGTRGFVYFDNPIDGGPPVERAGDGWTREGDTFDTLKLSPSIQRADPGGCRWHGFIGKDIPGEVTVA